jgi:hypothetical protein
MTAKAAPAKKRGPKWGIDEHPKKEQIVRALVAGKDSLRNIAKHYGLSAAALSRYLSGRLAPQAARVLEAKEMLDGFALIDQIRTVSARMQKLYDACDEYLTDPANPARYELGPRAWEIDVIYKAVEQSKPQGDELFDDLPEATEVRKKESLDVLLKKIERAGYEPVAVQQRQEDPRRLIIKTAEVLSKQLELVGRILGEVREPAQNSQVNIVMLAPKRAEYEEAKK